MVKEGDQYTDKRTRETFRVQYVRTKPPENCIVLKSITTGRQVTVEPAENLERDYTKG